MFARRCALACTPPVRAAVGRAKFCECGRQNPRRDSGLWVPSDGSVCVRAVCRKKKIVFVGLPGAFTPTCSTKSIPGYLREQDALKAKGVDEVIVVAVNDGAVMKAWAKDQGTEDSFLTFLADTRCEFSKALDLTIEPTPSLLGNTRCKRYAMYVEDGVIKVLNVAEGPNDPTGDGNPTVSFVEKMLADLE